MAADGGSPASEDASQQFCLRVVPAEFAGHLVQRATDLPDRFSTLSRRLSLDLFFRTSFRRAPNTCGGRSASTRGPQAFKSSPSRSHYSHRRPLAPMRQISRSHGERRTWDLNGYGHRSGLKGSAQFPNGHKFYDVVVQPRATLRHS